MYQFFIGKTFNSVEGKGEAKAEVSDINSGVSFRSQFQIQELKFYCFLLTLYCLPTHHVSNSEGTVF